MNFIKGYKWCCKVCGLCSSNYALHENYLSAEAGLNLHTATRHGFESPISGSIYPVRWKSEPIASDSSTRTQI